MPPNDFYSTFPHTADLGVEVRGKSIPELFENAAIALFDLMTNLNQIQEEETAEFLIQADDRELLLREWLGELLYDSISRHFLFKSFEIKQLSDRQLQAIAVGERFDSLRHVLKREIKSVTYHELKIIQDSNSWRARFILDI
jgi:SHS2 domain-containing protein